MDSDGLAGTTWKSVRHEHDGNWSQDVLTFTATEVTYVRNTDYGSTHRPLKGTYTYDHPTVTVMLENWSQGSDEMYMQRNVGTVKRKTMNIRIMTGDILWSMELKKQ